MIVARLCYQFTKPLAVDFLVQRRLHLGANPIQVSGADLSGASHRLNIAVAVMNFTRLARFQKEPIENVVHSPMAVP